MSRPLESSSSETDMKLWLPSVIIVMGAPIPYQIRKLKFENDALYTVSFLVLIRCITIAVLSFSQSNYWTLCNWKEFSRERRKEDTITVMESCCYSTFEDKHSYFLQSTLVMCIQMQMAFLAMLCCFYVHGITYMRAYLFLVLSVLKGPSDLIKKCFVGVQGKTKIQNVESGFLIRTQNFRIFWMYMDGDIDL